MVKDFGNTLQQATVVNPNKTIRSVIGDKDKFDFLRFNLADPGKVSISLSQLTNQANLALLDGKGKVIARSIRPGKKAENIFAELEEGTYFVKITGKKGKAKYRLKLASTAIESFENSAPNNVTLNNASIAENQSAGATVGVLTTSDPNVGDTHTYSLVSGEGSADNSAFRIEGNVLKANQSFDFETKNTYSIRIRTDDGKGGIFEKPITITIGDINENTLTSPPENKAPTNMTLNKSSIAENQSAGATVGVLTTSDPNVGDTHTYSLVSGEGSADNSAFRIEGNVLKANQSFDFETKNTYSIRIRTDDGKGGVFEKPITITIGNVSELPGSPNINTNTGLKLGRGTDARIGSALLKVTDDKDSAAQLKYTLTSTPENGTLSLNGIVLGVGATFTQADLDNNGLVYQSLDDEEILGFGDLVDILEVDGSNVFFTERNFGFATLKFRDASTAAATTLSTDVQFFETTPPGGTAPVLQLANGGIDGSNVAFTEAGNLFFYNGNTSVKPVNISQKLPGFSNFNFYDIEGSNVVFEAFDGNDFEHFLFKGATGAVERLTDNSEDDIDLKISGNSITWRSLEGSSNYDVFLYDTNKGNPIQNKINLTANNLFGGTDADALVAGISGQNIVIEAVDPDTGDIELFFSNGTPNGLTRLTTNVVNDIFGGMSGNTIVWTTGGNGTDTEIAVQTVGDGSPIVVTQNDVTDVLQEVDGTNIVWQVLETGKLFYRNGTGDAVEITKNQLARTASPETFLGMDGVNVIWKSVVEDGTDQLFFGNMETGTVKQLTNVPIGSPLQFGEISGSDVLYSIGDSIYLVDGNGGSPITVSPSGGTFTGFGQHAGSSVAWSRPSGFGEEGVFGNFALSDGFGFTVKDSQGASTSGTFNITVG